MNFYIIFQENTLIVKELSIVSSAILLLMLTWSISRARSSSADMIFKTCPGILWETVFKRTCGPENLTSTSATRDLELATSSLILSLMEEVEEVGDGSRELDIMVFEMLL